MLEFIKTFFAKHKYAVIITALAIVFAGVNLIQWNQKDTLKKQLVVAEQNLDAATDTLRVTRDRNGKIEYDKLSFLTSSINDLQKLNANLYDEVKATQGKVNTIIKAGVTIVHDTVPLIVNSNVRDGVVTSNFNFDTTYSPGNYRKVSGFTTYNLKTDTSGGLLTSDIIAFTASTGIRELNGKREIFLKPDYPGLVVTHLEGAQIDDNLLKGKSTGPLLNFSISAGYLPVIYNWNTGKTDWFGSNVGVSAGVSINVNKLFKK